MVDFFFFQTWEGYNKATSEAEDCKTFMIDIIYMAAFCTINCFWLLKIIPYHLSIHHRLCSAVVSTFASQQEGQGFNCWTSGLSVPEWMVVISPP